MRITQAPSGNFVIDTISSTTNDRKQPIPWITMLLRQPGCRWREVVLHHAGLREREAGEHADGVERDQPGDHAAGGDDEEHGHAGQHDDAVRVHEAVAALGHLPGQEAVAGLEARQAREVGEARCWPP